MRDQAGEPERLIGVNIDISERKRVEDALQESQKQLVLALDSSKTAMFDWDVVQRRGMWNPQMAAIYDFHPKNEYITAESGAAYSILTTGAGWFTRLSKCGWKATSSLLSFVPSGAMAK